MLNVCDEAGFTVQYSKEKHLSTRIEVLGIVIDAGALYRCLVREEHPSSNRTQRRGPGGHYYNGITSMRTWNYGLMKEPVILKEEI